MTTSRIAIGLGLCLAALVANIRPLSAQDDAKSSLAAGRKSLAAARGAEDEERQRIHEEALELFRSVGTRWPDALAERADAAIEAGELLRRLGRTEEALAAYAEVQDYAAPGAKKAEALLATASLKRRTKDVEGAVAALERLVREFPDEERWVAEARLDLAGIARDEKRWATALRQSRSVLEEHPGLWRPNVDACGLLLGILVRCHQWETAATEMERLDTLMKQRFGTTKHWPAVEREMARLSARKSLTPIPVTDP